MGQVSLAVVFLSIATSVFTHADGSSSVAAGTTTSGIDFAQGPGTGTISGIIVADGTSSPLPNVPVAVFPDLVTTARAWTDAMGRYTISGLSPGTYRLRTMLTQTQSFDPMSSRYADEWYGGVCIGCAGTPMAVRVGESENVSGIDFSLALGGAISGTITCEGLVLGDIALSPPSIYAYSASGVLVRTSARFTRGCDPSDPSTLSWPYVIEGLPPGQYYLLARDGPFGAFGGDFVDVLYGDIVCITEDCDVRRGLPVTVTSGSTTTGVDFTARRGASSVFASVPPAPLGVFVGPLGVYDARGVELVSVFRVVTDTLYHRPLWYEVVGLPPGTYYARWGDVLSGGLSCVDCPPTVGRPILVRPGDRFVNFGPPTSGPPTTKVNVSGTVRDAGGVPLRAIVELRAGSLLFGTATTDESGRYTITSVAPGTYVLRTRNIACAACDVRRGGTPVVVGSADVTGIDFTIAAGGVIAGVVGDPTGVGVANVPVSVFDAAGTLVEQVTSSATGSFRMAVPPGTYRARAEATVGYGAEVYREVACTSGRCDVSAGAPITIATGATVSGIDFTLPSCPDMTLSPSLLATGVAGRAYRQVVGVTGGVSPFTFEVTTEALPPGLTLDRRSGVVSGVPSTSGRYSFQVAAIDANGCGTARAYTVDVHACAFVLSSSSATVPSVGGPVAVTIGDACGSQEVANAPFWVHVASNTTGRVVLTVDPNAAPVPRTATLSIGRRVFEVRQSGQTSQPPFGVLDAPFDGQQVAGAVAVGGWALDDLEVARVRLYRDAVPPETPGLVYLGTAVFIEGARPDVERVFRTMPLSHRAGWGFLILTNTLPNQGNGGFRIHAIAEDVEGKSTLLGSRTIFGLNATSRAPFGTIDTPGQGDTISGADYVNFGWALTPQPAMIPFDGSTIQVIVDGAPLGSVNYNFFRPDVSGIFPGLKNSGGPVGYRVLDTTRLAEGLHTIAWVVTDDLGVTSGLGSRFFRVANSAEAQAPAAPGSVSSVAASTDASSEVMATPLATMAAAETGRRVESLASVPLSEAAVLVHRDASPPRRLRLQEHDDRTVTLAPMERLELHLSPGDSECAGRWSGFLVKDGVLADLPVGASLDPTGTFYWQTGPGFAGRFDLLFLRTDCAGAQEQLPVTALIDKR